MEEELLQNLEKLRTTPLGAQRIRQNLALDMGTDPVEWCRARIATPGCAMARRGKNWYATVEGCVITVNAGSFTIITAHQQKKKRA